MQLHSAWVELIILIAYNLGLRLAKLIALNDVGVIIVQHRVKMLYD